VSVRWPSQSNHLPSMMNSLILLCLVSTSIVSARNVPAGGLRRNILNATAMANSSYYPPIPPNTNYAGFVPDMT
jgi:hypothetical protein